MKKLIKRNDIQINAVSSFKSKTTKKKKCSCSCPKCEKWYVNTKRNIKSITSLSS